MKLKLVLVTLLFFLVQPVFSAKIAQESKQESGSGTADVQKSETKQETKEGEKKQEPKSESKPGEADKKEGDYKMDVKVPLTTLDFVLTDRHGSVLEMDLKEDEINDMLEVKEDGVPQKITFFEPRDTRKSIVLLLDYSKQAVIWSYYSNGDVWVGPFYLINSLQDKDYISIVTYDLVPRKQLDFTRNKDEAMETIRSLGNPMFSESNLSDAVWKVLDAIKDRKERMAVVLISTGLDTFPRSGRSFEDEVLKRVANERVNFYTISIGNIFKIKMDPYLSAPARLDLLVAENRLKFLAEYSGGFFSAPRFEAEYPDIFKDIAARLDKQYTIGYYPTNRNFNGKSRKIKVTVKKNYDINKDGKIDKNDEIRVVCKTEYFPGKTFKPDKH